MKNEKLSKPDLRIESCKKITEDHSDLIKRGVHEILDLSIGYKCNNNCIFCTDGKKERKKSKKAICDEIKNNKKLKRVVFVYGEPTLNKDLMQFIKLCKINKYEIISITTNGRMLAYDKYLENLLKQGINEIIISIHGHNKRIHEAATRTPGSFEQTKKGLENLNKAHKKFKFKFLIATTITNININYLKQICDFVSEFTPDGHTLNIVEPKGFAKTNYKSLAPKMTQIIKQIKKLKKQKYKLNIIGIPFCAECSLNHHIGLKAKHLFQDPKTFPNLRTDDMYDFTKKRNECDFCKYNSICPGPWREYIKLYGWNEFKPIIK